MANVKAKKHLGQHFLTDMGIAQDIAEGLIHHMDYKKVLEIGPGMGVLTQFLLPETKFETHCIEIDKESIVYLKKHYPTYQSRFMEGDFLQMELDKVFGEPFAVIGNFPYNISSQIFFKVLDYKDLIPEVVGMLQKEVAERLSSPPGSRDYGILSVFLQAYYDVEYLFTVEPHVFNPPPKVRSGVIRAKRNGVAKLDCDEKMFIRVVKAGFGQRRKTLRNALKVLNLPLDNVSKAVLDNRAEQLSVADFVELTNILTVKS